MSPEEHAHWWLREESCAECECDKPFSPPSCICARDLTNMFRAAQSQARDEALEEAADEVQRAWREAPNQRTDSALTSFVQNAVGPGCQFAIDAIRALKASKP
jgi:hypothetical protein